MYKKIVILILLLLTGCSNNKSIACTYIDGDKSQTINIDAINDVINGINIRVCFVLPKNLLADQEKYDFIVQQLDDSYHFEDNVLVREYNIEINSQYSYELTINDLKNRRFYCE